VQEQSCKSALWRCKKARLGKRRFAESVALRQADLPRAKHAALAQHVAARELVVLDCLAHKQWRLKTGVIQDGVESLANAICDVALLCGTEAEGVRGDSGGVPVILPAPLLPRSVGSMGANIEAMRLGA
jgi:hypothetical protein